jgi:putative ABC transport system ATP-binding protein
MEMGKQEQTVVAVASLCKGYSQGSVRVSVLNDLSMSIARGESVAILGVSGTGKSTLLNILSGIDRADKGRVSIQGVDIARLDSAGLATYRREQVGFIFQFYNLIPTLTAVEDVMTGWEAAGKPAKEGEQASREILATLGMADKADRFPEQLSGGEQQRVAIARALVKRPALVLADEPTGNLDPKTAASTTQLLLDQARQFASALIIVTHNPLIGEHTDRTLVLRNGQLEEHKAAAITPVRELAA